MGLDKEKKMYLQINLSQIIPDVKLPFSLYFFFKGNFVEVVKKNQPMTIGLVAKSLLEENYFAYIAEEDKSLWSDWSIKFRRVDFLESFSKLEDSKETIKKKIKYFQLSVQNVRSKNERIEQKKLVSEAEGQMRLCINHPVMAPFFLQSFDDSILKHSARVTFLLILFILSHPELLDIKDAQYLIYSSMIHELHGDPESVFDPNAHQETLELLQKNQMIFPEKIINIIQSHDELYSGKGLPGIIQGEVMDMSLRVFSLINRFDHTYLLSTQNPSRKIRLEKTLETLANSAKHFDPTVFEYFNQFILNIDYIV